MATSVSRRWCERALFGSGWVGIAILGWVVVSRLLATTFPTKVTVLLQSLTPIAFLPLYPLAVAAAVRRRIPQALVCVVLILIHVGSLAPAVGHRPLPAWVASAPRIRVLSANTYDGNATPVAAARFLVDQPVDVLLLVEVSAPMHRALLAAGIDERFPYHQTGRFGAGTRNIEAIYSRVPLTRATSVAVGVQSFPSASVPVGPRRLRLIPVHVQDPLGNRVEWAAELAALRRIAEAEAGPLVVAGDFNSTRWNPLYGKLLALGLHDASESRGQGLSFSWPVHRLLPFPVMRLDHGLGSAGVEATRVRSVTVPGSDHRGLLVTWAVDPG